MPTIEIHGYGSINGDVFRNRAAVEVRQRILVALQDASYIDKVLVVDAHTTATNHKGEPARFLRIWMKTDEKELLKDLIVCLEHLNMRLQFAQLATQLAPNDDSQEDLFAGARADAARSDAVGEFGAAGFHGAGRDQPFAEPPKPHKSDNRDGIWSQER